MCAVIQSQGQLCTFSGEEEKELIHLADTTSANLSQIQGRELHNVKVQKTLISIYTNALARGTAKACCREVICFALLDEKELHKINVRATSKVVVHRPNFSAIVYIAVRIHVMFDYMNHNIGFFHGKIPML